MFAAFAEFERNRIRERTKEGIERAALTERAVNNVSRTLKTLDVFVRLLSS